VDFFSDASQRPPLDTADYMNARRRPGSSQMSEASVCWPSFIAQYGDDICEAPCRPTPSVLSAAILSLCCTAATLRRRRLVSAECRRCQSQLSVWQDGRGIGSKFQPHPGHDDLSRGPRRVRHKRVMRVARQQLPWQCSVTLKMRWIRFWLERCSGPLREAQNAAADSLVGWRNNFLPLPPLEAVCLVFVYFSHRLYSNVAMFWRIVSLCSSIIGSSITSFCLSVCLLEFGIDKNSICWCRWCWSH